MPPPILEAVAGAPVRETLRLTDRNGDPVTTYTGNEPLTGECSTGDRTASLFAPVFTWNDATAGTVDLAIAGTDTDTLSDGDYPVFLTIAGSPPAGPVRVAILRLESGPGTAVALTAYCEYEDMLRVAGNLIGNLAEDADQTGFADARAEAKEWTNREILSRASTVFNRWAIGWVDTGKDWLDVLNDANDTVTDATDPFRVKEAFLATVRAYLAADKLLLTAGDDQAIIDANAMYALSLVYSRQVGMLAEYAGKDSSFSYRALGQQWREQAIRKLGAATFRIDQAGDGSVILRLEP